MCIYSPPYDSSCCLSTGDVVLFFQCAELPACRFPRTIKRFSNITRCDYWALDSPEYTENVIKSDGLGVPSSISAFTRHNRTFAFYDQMPIGVCHKVYTTWSDTWHTT